MNRNRIEAMRELAKNLISEGQVSRGECVLELCDALASANNAIKAIVCVADGPAYGIASRELRKQQP